MEQSEKKSLSKDIKSLYKDMQSLYDTEYFEENSFTEKFLAIYDMISQKVILLLEGCENSVDNIKKLLDNSFIKAIDFIIKHANIREIKLPHSLFLQEEKDDLNGKRRKLRKFKETGKYDEFLEVYYSIYIGQKDTGIEISIENLDKKTKRKIPYRIIHLKNKNNPKTILICNQIGEITYIYDGIIEVDNFSKIKKGESIDGKTPAQIAYNSRYKETLHSLLVQNIDNINIAHKSNKELIEEELEYCNEIYLKTILQIVTDKDGNKVDNINLNEITVSEFTKLFFGHGTKFGLICGHTILVNNDGNNNIILKKILELCGIIRKDLPSEIFDYHNPEHIKEILSIITNNKGDIIDIDLNKIGIVEFRKLYFGYGTKFGKISGNTLLTKFGQGINNKTLNVMLNSYGIL